MLSFFMTHGEDFIVTYYFIIPYSEISFNSIQIFLAEY